MLKLITLSRPTFTPLLLRGTAEEPLFTLLPRRRVYSETRFLEAQASARLYVDGPRVLKAPLQFLPGLSC
jgi:hypothetical protein